MGGRDQHYPLPPWEGNIHLYFSHWKDIYYAHLISYNGQLKMMLLLLLSQLPENSCLDAGTKFVFGHVLCALRYLAFCPPSAHSPHLRSLIP